MAFTARLTIALVAITAALGFTTSAFGADITITHDTTLTADQSGTTFVGADGITLDCAGHTVSATGWAAIDLTNHTGVTIENCNVVGAEGAGIWVHGSSGNTIVDNTASGNGTGIWLFEGSANNVVRGNDVSNNSFYGLWVQSDSNGNAIANNVASRMQYSGIFLIFVSHNTLTGNTTNANGGAPVGPLDAGQGIYLVQSHSNTIDGNSASGNISDGFQLRSSNDNALRNDNGSKNGRDGFGLWDQSARNRIDGAVMNGNRFDGVQVVVSPSTTVTNSEGNGNGGYAVDDDYSDALTCIGNTGSDNTYGGFFSIRSTGNVYRDNTAMRNGGAPVGPLDQGEGFYLYETDQTTMSDDLAVNNVTDGFQLRGATHTRLEDNKSLANRRVGVGLFADDFGNASTGNTITGNLARGNKVADWQDIAPAGSNAWFGNNLG
jgi:parallel beta-helix repeat protein